tara:strand:+ start:188 stop:520 length:333 start_codon:yes stop_codon:yes gene_type:complete
MPKATLSKDYLAVSNQGRQVLLDRDECLALLPTLLEMIKPDQSGFEYHETLKSKVWICPVGADGRDVTVIQDQEGVCLLTPSVVTRQVTQTEAAAICYALIVASFGGSNE